MLILTDLAGTFNSLIGGKDCENKQNGALTVSQIRERKFQQREIDLDKLTDEERRSRYRFNRESIKNLVEILKDDVQRQTRNKHALSPICAPYLFFEAGGRKTR